MLENITPKQIWYKTKAGKIFLIVLSIFLISSLGFMLLAGYYIWKLKYGNAEELIQKFSQSFTLDPSKQLLKQSGTINKNPKDFIYQSSPTLGADNAPITILAFIDFECPFCQKSFPIFKTISEQYAPAINVVFKHLPVPTIHENAMSAHLAATCAQEQGKFWEYYDLLFTRKMLDNTSLMSYAAQLRLNQKQFTDCMDTKKYQKNINQDLLDAVELEIRGTPTYIVNQKKLEGVAPLEVWNSVIIEELQR